MNARTVAAAPPVLPNFNLEDLAKHVERKSLIKWSKIRLFLEICGKSNQIRLKFVKPIAKPFFKIFPIELELLNNSCLHVEHNGQQQILRQNKNTKVLIFKNLIAYRTYRGP